MLSILLFFAISIFIVLGLYIFATFYNKRALAATDKFIAQTGMLVPTVFKDVKLRYWIIKGGKTQFSPNNRCDLYLFDNYLAIVRRQDFVFKVFFAPVLLTADVAATKNSFGYLRCYQPDYIDFNQPVEGQVAIKIKDPVYSHRKIEITFKDLPSGQTKQLVRIKNWCRQL
jgi:hypothetical protein